MFFFQRIPPLRINDLINDLRDGTKLLALLEILSGEKLVIKSFEYCSNNIFIKLIMFFFSLWRGAEFYADHIF